MFAFQLNRSKMCWWNSDARERVPDASCAMCSSIRGAHSSAGLICCVSRALILLLNGHKARNKSTIKWVTMIICSYCYYGCIKKK